jgi:hypothetical protein
MSGDFAVEGTNAKAAFSLKIHRGDGMALLAMNWRDGPPPRDFAGFGIEYREPDKDRWYVLTNRIGFPGQRPDSASKKLPSLRAPIQKFRWVHFPRQAAKEGVFIYRVTPVFMNEWRETSLGDAQTAAIALRRETIPGMLNVAFTRGFVSSQAFVDKYQRDGKISTLIPDAAKLGLDFAPTHPKSGEALGWMGFEAREAICALLDEAIAKADEVRVIAYDLNLPEILTRLTNLGSRLKIIIDDSGAKGSGHAAGDSPESVAALALVKSAGKERVRRQHMSGLQHHKSIAVRGPGLHKVLYGSTNFTWRGFYVQNNNAVIVNSEKAVKDYFDAFDSYFDATGEEFRAGEQAKSWFSLGLAGIDAKVAFSPHDSGHGRLKEIAADIDRTKSSVFFSLAFLGQMTKGPIGPSLGRAIADPRRFALGIADASVKAQNLGVEVLQPDGRKKVVRAEALIGHVPKPFSEEPSGLSGSHGQHRGTRMHHKFVVLDFDTDDARVYLGSYNFSEAADGQNGENLLVVRDRRAATSYMIEALRIYDHYRFRVVNAEAKKKREKLELKLPPATKKDRPWWQRDLEDAVRIRDRELFA